MSPSHLFLIKAKKKSKQKEILLEQVNESQIKRSSPKQNNLPIKLVFFNLFELCCYQELLSHHKSYKIYSLSKYSRERLYSEVHTILQGSLELHTADTFLSSLRSYSLCMKPRLNHSKISIFIALLQKKQTNN